MEYTLKQLKALIDSVAGYVVIYEVKDDAFYPLVYTKNVPSFSGLSEEEYLSLYKEDAAKVVPETDLPVLTQALQKAFALKEEQETVYRTYHKTKGFVWTHVFFKVLGTYGGNVVFLGSFSDASAASQEPKLLLDHSNQKIYVIERETYDLLYANAAARADKDHLPQLGDTCYKYIRQQNSPCGNCVIQHAVYRKAVPCIVDAGIQAGRADTAIYFHDHSAKRQCPLGAAYHYVSQAAGNGRYHFLLGRA